MTRVAVTREPGGSGRVRLESGGFDGRREARRCREHDIVTATPQGACRGNQRVEVAVARDGCEEKAHLVSIAGAAPTAPSMGSGCRPQEALPSVMLLRPIPVEGIGSARDLVDQPPNPRLASGGLTLTRPNRTAE